MMTSADYENQSDPHRRNGCAEHVIIATSEAYSKFKLGRSGYRRFAAERSSADGEARALRQADFMSLHTSSTERAPVHRPTLKTRRIKTAEPDPTKFR